MKWERFLTALSTGGWVTDMWHSAALTGNTRSSERVHLTSKRDGVVINTAWAGQAPRKLAELRLNNDIVPLQRLEELLK